jgi:hypothetical protein
MRCHVVCYHNQIIITNSKTKLRKKIISYFKNNGITSLKKNVDVDHVVFPKKFEEKPNNFGRALITKEPTKQRPNISTTSIPSFYGSIIPFKKNEPQQKTIGGV